MRKPIWSVLFLAILLGSYLLGAMRREGFLQRQVAPAGIVEPEVRMPRTQEAARVFTFEDAQKRMDRERHDQAWWKEHFQTIVRTASGHYYLDGAYWYPAFGFDPEHDTYVFDGPIAAIGNLAPDEVIACVQTKLELDGYYPGSTDGMLDEPTRVALTMFQVDHHLDISTGVDVPTLIALGLV